MFDFIKNIIGGKKKMINADQLTSIRDGLSKFKEFQWIKGDSVGEVCLLKDVVQADGGIVFVEFTNGSRCNMALLDEYILKIGSADASLDFSKNDAVKAAEISSNGNNGHAAVIGSSRLKPEQSKLSPIQELLKKRKSNPVDITIDLKLNVPPRELLEVLKDSFENAEDEVVEFVLSSISADNIKESVKAALKEFYQLYHEEENGN